MFNNTVREVQNGKMSECYLFGFSATRGFPTLASDSHQLYFFAKAIADSLLVFPTAGKNSLQASTQESRCSAESSDSTERKKLNEIKTSRMQSMFAILRTSRYLNFV